MKPGAANDDAGIEPLELRLGMDVEQRIGRGLSLEADFAAVELERPAGEIVVAADEVGAAYCLLCETIEYPESRDWVIFHLRPEARFSDGTPVTAQDVMFSYEQLRDKGLSSFRAVFAHACRFCPSPCRRSTVG